ncbi:hypothetical protein [Streptomyces sp. NPDC047525]|uniref:hypothetical protein n=1 Tax=Streptomyces sp. NPDC047525 TaxID=3155264 RepID=UPI0033D4375A
MRLRRGLLAGGLVLVVVGAWVGCAEWPVETPSAKTASAQGPVVLEDGRRVMVRFTKRGLTERHRGADGGSWSQPRVLHPTAGDGDCRVDLSTYQNTVAVIAHHNEGCYLGDADDTVIAAVSDGDLTQWDTHVTKGEDGWEWTRFSWSGYRVVFRKEDGEGVHELSWRQSIGFTGPSRG